MPGAVEGFRQLSQHYECRVVSARAGLPGAHKGRRYFGSEPLLYLRPHWSETPAHFKVRMVQASRQAHFEDDPHTAEWIAELIPDVFLVDWRRNRWLDGPNIHRIERIADAVPLLADVRES